MVDFGESFGKNIGNIQYALDKLPTGHYNEVTEWLLWRDDMARDTKNRIIETALALFSQSGYLATSMNDIAQQVGLTKAALYKHFSGKQEILDCIVAQMERMDLERAQEYEMPETGLAAYSLDEARGKVPADSEVIYLGWVMAGTVKGYAAAAKRYIVRAVCAVGMAQPGAQEKILRERNKLPESVPLFQLQGNFDVKKLHGMYRLMMEVMVKTAGKSLAAKSGRTAEEDDMLDMMTNGGERVRAENLHAVLAWYRRR